MKRFMVAAAFAGVMTFAASSATAAKYTQTIPAGDELVTFYFNLPSWRPVRFIASGDFTNVWSSVIAQVNREQVFCFYDTPTSSPDCQFDGEIINGQQFEFGPRSLDVIFDEDENSDCDPYTYAGAAVAHCEYRTITSIMVDVSNSGDEPVDFTVKLTTVPEPSAWALCILGFATAGAALRRRTRTA